MLLPLGTPHSFFLTLGQDIGSLATQLLWEIATKKKKWGGAYTCIYIRRGHLIKGFVLTDNRGGVESKQLAPGINHHFLVGGGG